jgi:hypothetical protein
MQSRYRSAKKIRAFHSKAPENRDPQGTNYNRSRILGIAIFTAANLPW